MAVIEEGAEDGRLPDVTRAGVANRIKALLAAGAGSISKENAYEALQLFSSQAKRKAKDGEPQAGIGVALEGATALIENDYPECGLELGSVILDVAQEADKEAGKGNGQPVPADLVQHALLHIDSTLASQGGKQGTNDGIRKKLLKAALKWSVGKGPRAFGDKEINATYGELLWATGELDKAVPRLVLAEAPGTLAEKLLEAYPLSNDGGAPQGREDRERLVCLAVLSFLGHENLRDANLLMDAYKDALKRGGGSGEESSPAGVPGGSSPLVTFLVFLLQTCERDAASLYEGLLKVYMPYLNAEPAFQPLLTAIGERFFGLRPPPSMMSMLSSMLGMGGGGMGRLFG